MNWFYDAGAGQRQGPISAQELQALLDSQTIHAKTLVWREGMANWMPLDQALPDLALGAGGPTQCCDACGSVQSPSQLVEIGARQFCAACKPNALLQLQSGVTLPSLNQAERTGPAWEQRAELGVFAAAVATVKGVLLKPAETFSAMKREGGLRAPMTYTLLLGTIGSFFGILYQIVSNVGLSRLQLSKTPGFESLPGIEDLSNPVLIVIGLIALAIFLPLMLLLASFIHAGVLHLSLMICGGAKQPFETTYRVCCYCSGSSSILQIVPVCGALTAGIWGLVAACIGVAKAHEIDTGRAVIAILLPTLLCCIIGIGAGVMVAALAAGHH